MTSAEKAEARIFELEQRNIGLVEMNRACVHDRDHAQARIAELETELSRLEQENSEDDAEWQHSFNVRESEMQARIAELEARVVQFEELIRVGLLVSPSGPRDCTDAERAVLDAMAGTEIYADDPGPYIRKADSRQVAKAELARREAAK